MLQCVYEDNLRLGERRRRPRLRLLSHSRRRSTWALLGITLVFGPALGYLGPSVFVDGQETRQSSALQLPPSQPEPFQAEQTAHSLTYFPFIPAELDFAVLDGPGQFPDTESGSWSDFDMLLRDDHSPLTAVFGLDVKTIVIDPGHGEQIRERSAPRVQWKRISHLISPYGCATAYAAPVSTEFS